MKLPRRSILTGSLGLGGLALATRQAAAANVPFTTFAFPATGEPTSRTMPDRLAEVKNVRDFGAVGDDTHNDAPNIQAAVDWTTGPNRGTIYFPPGFYKCNSPIVLSNNGLTSICLRGDGEVSVINGVFVGPGFTLDRTLGSPNNVAQVIIEKLQILGPTTSGCGGIRVGSCNSVVIRDLSQVTGYTGITTEDSAGKSSQNVFIQNVTFSGASVSGSNGFIMGGPGTVQGCSWNGFDTGARMYGNGWAFYGNRIEDCNTAWLLGVDSSGTAQTTSGFVIFASSSEGALTFMNFAGPCSAFFIGPMGFLAHATSGYNANLPTQYGLLIPANNASNGVFMGIDAIGDLFDTAALSLGASTTRANLVFESCSFSKGSGTGVDVIAPSNAYTAQFQQCTFGTYSPVWTYSELPTIGGGNDQEGDEFSITDANTAAWGATVSSGGGADACLVRNNGTNYTVVAI
jgi:hypothetical protein